MFLDFIHSVSASLFLKTQDGIQELMLVLSSGDIFNRICHYMQTHNYLNVLIQTNSFEQSLLREDNNQSEDLRGVSLFTVNCVNDNFF